MLVGGAAGSQRYRFCFRDSGVQCQSQHRGEVSLDTFAPPGKNPSEKITDARLKRLEDGCIREGPTLHEKEPNEKQSNHQPSAPIAQSLGQRGNRTNEVHGDVPELRQNVNGKSPDGEGANWKE